jgi:hypothetical protein
LPLLFSLVVAGSKSTPRHDTHPFGLAHGYDVTLEVPIGSAPSALVHHELAEAMVTSVLVGFGHNPCRSVRNAEVEDLALIGKGIETVHDFLD